MSYDLSHNNNFMHHGLGIASHGVMPESHNPYMMSHENLQASKGNVGVGVSSNNGKPSGHIHGSASGHPTDNSTVTVHGKADTRGNKEVGVEVEVSW